MYTDYQEETKQDENNEFQNGNDKEKLKRILFYVLIFVVALILIILLFKGCSRDNNEGSNGGNSVIEQTPTVAINRQNITLEVGEELQLYADVLMTDVGNPVVSWHSEDSSIASVNDEGVVSANKEGTTIIIATYEEKGKTYENKCNVTVTFKEVKVEKINIQQENISLKKGKSLVLQVETYPTDAKVEKLIYTSDDPSIATVNSEGVVNAIKKGITTITVKTSDSRLSDSVTVTVTEEGTTVISPVNLQLTGLSNTLKVGQTATVYYIITPSNATNQKLTWTSTNQSVATVKDGVITALKVGTTYIVASTSNNITAQLKITVDDNTIPINSITIDQGQKLEMKTGGTKKLTYSITPSNATNKEVVFSTSNKNIVTVSSTGLLHAVGSGNAIVTIKAKNNSKVYARINVSVTGTSNPSEGSSNNSGSTGDSSSCTSYNMVTVSSNGKGVVYTEIKDGMKVAKEAVEVEITNISSCINKLEYALSCSSQGCNYVTAKVGTKFKVAKDGLNTIVMRGTKKDGTTLTKYYYVKTEIKPDLTVKKTYNLQTATFLPTITNQGSGNANIHMCVSKTSTNCEIDFSNKNFIVENGKTKEWKRVTYNHVCFQVKDGSGNYSSKKCYGIKDNIIISE